MFQDIGQFFISFDGDSRVKKCSVETGDTERAQIPRTRTSDPAQVEFQMGSILDFECTLLNAGVVDGKSYLSTEIQNIGVPKIGGRRMQRVIGAWVALIHLTKFWL